MASCLVVTVGCNAHAPTIDEQEHASQPYGQAVSSTSFSSSSKPLAASDSPETYDPPVRIETGAVNDSMIFTETGAAAKIRMLDVGTLLIGDESAPVTLTAFLDYDCDYCHLFATQTLPTLSDSYIDTGKMNVILMYMPFTAAGTSAAKAAICSLEQNTFLAFHAKLIAGYPLTEASMTKLAKDLKMDTVKWNRCRASEFADGILKTHQAFAASKNVTRVPSFILGADQWVGIISLPQWKEKIAKALASK